MLRTQREKEWKKEAIILLICRHFLLLFHPLEAQEVHPQTIWYLEICCESWGSARVQQYPRGPWSPSPHLLSPAFHGRVSFTSFPITLLPVCLLPGPQHLCCITVQKTIPALRQANGISSVSSPRSRKATGINPLCSLWQSVTERLAGGTGALLERLPQGPYAEVWGHRLCLSWAAVIVSLLWCTASRWALHCQWGNQSRLTWNWQTHNGLSALAFVIHFVSWTCL